MNGSVGRRGAKSDVVVRIPFEVFNSPAHDTKQCTHFVLIDSRSSIVSIDGGRAPFSRSV
jgi:hypothetical protein